MPTRNIPKEQTAIGIFKKNNQGAAPETPEDWSFVHRHAYGDSFSDLPDELKSNVTQAYYEGTNQPKTLEEMKSGITGASGRVQELGAGNSAMRILQDAIKKKSGAAQEPLGESKIFEQAGISGSMGALSASLAARGKEMEINRTSFANILNEASGIYKDKIYAASKNYDNLLEQYKIESTRMDKIDGDLRDHEQSIELLNLQHGMNKEIKNLRPSPSPEELQDGKKYGYTWESGDWTKMRTDRHFNPTAMTTDVAATLGLVEGVDYKKGDPFPDNPNLFTAHFIGDPIHTTIRGLDQTAESQTMKAFYTQGGGQRWNHTAMSDEDWLAKSYDEKREVIKEMYQKEGGSGELFGEGNLMDNISATARLFYEGKYVPGTPSQHDALVSELADAGLELPFSIDAKAIISGIYKSYELLTRIPEDKRGQIEGRFQEYTKGAERNEDIQAFKSQVSMVGMFLARLVEKGRLSDQDRIFYLDQMPSLRQSNDTIAKESADILANIVAEKFNIDTARIKNTIEPIGDDDLNSYLEQDYVVIQDPETEETRQYNKGTLNLEDLKDALDQGYIII